MSTAPRICTNDGKVLIRFVLTTRRDPVYLPAYYATVLGHPDVPYQAPMPLNVTGQRVLYFTSTNPNVTNDACSPLPASTPDLSDKVVVVKRGTCDFTVKLANVAKAGG